MIRVNNPIRLLRQREMSYWVNTEAIQDRHGSMTGSDAQFLVDVPDMNSDGFLADPKLRTDLGRRQVLPQETGYAKLPRRERKASCRATRRCRRGPQGRIARRRWRFMAGLHGLDKDFRKASETRFRTPALGFSDGLVARWVQPIGVFAGGRRQQEENQEHEGPHDRDETQKDEGAMLSRVMQTPNTDSKGRREDCRCKKDQQDAANHVCLGIRTCPPDHQGNQNGEVHQLESPILAPPGPALNHGVLTPRGAVPVPEAVVRQRRWPLFRGFVDAVKETINLVIS